MGMIFNWPVESMDWLEPGKHLICYTNKEKWVAKGDLQTVIFINAL